jgi:hypothetical protein
LPVEDADPAVVSLAWRAGDQSSARTAFIDTVRRIASNRKGL